MRSITEQSLKVETLTWTTDRAGDNSNPSSRNADDTPGVCVEGDIGFEETEPSGD